MQGADTLAALGDDLRALTGRERRAVLAALSPFERAQVIALIEATATPERPSGPDFSRFSPWLAHHLRSGEGSLTPATRRLLTEAAGELSILPDGGEPAPERRSLAGAFGQWLLPRRSRR